MEQTDLIIALSHSVKSFPPEVVISSRSFARIMPAAVSLAIMLRVG